jgi:hypothetical protein
MCHTTLEFSQGACKVSINIYNLLIRARELSLTLTEITQYRILEVETRSPQNLTLLREYQSMSRVLLTIWHNARGGRSLISIVVQAEHMRFDDVLQSFLEPGLTHKT